MFEKRKDSEEVTGTGSYQAPPMDRTPIGPVSERSAAAIGSTIRIKGEVIGEENLLIEGTIEGSVKLSDHDLTIGPNGRVEANLTAKTVSVQGQVTGDITGSEKVVITQAGRVLGNIKAPRVMLEDGARFKGAIDMDPGGAAVTSTPPKRAAAPAKPEPAEEKRSQTSG